MTASGELIVLVGCVGLLVRRVVRLWRENPGEYRFPRLNRAIDLLVVLVGTVQAAVVLDVLVTGKVSPDGWVDWITLILVVALVGAIPVLAAGCVVFVNRHRDGQP